MQQAAVPPAVHVPRRWFLLPHERWLAQRISDRFQRVGLRNPSQLRLVAKHGTLGLVMVTVCATQIATLGGVVFIGGVVALFASAGASFAYWILIVVAVGAFFALVRVLQMASTEPDENDRDFLARAGYVPADIHAAKARTHDAN